MAGKKPSPILPVFKSCLYLTILFLGIMSYIYGSLYKSSKRAHNLKVLAVDFDNDTIGKSLRTAYSRLQGSDFLGLEFESSTSFPHAQSARDTICSREFWGVIYTHAGATQRLFARISGNDTLQNSSSTAITFVYNGVYYPVISEAYIAAKLQELVAATAQIFYNTTAPILLQNVNSSDSAAVAALFHPVTAESIVLFPAEAGPRVLPNTITMVVPPLMQFFYIMALDHISIAMHVFSTDNKPRLYVDRLLGSKAFGFVGALVVTAFICAFREDWKFTSVHFVETWLCFWFYMDICYQIMDSVIGTIVSMRFAPFFIFTWVILNVTSTLFPFELNPGFYKWGYALPAHNIWFLLMSVWSNSCVSRLQVALPVCFAWWVVGHFTSVLAVSQKCSQHAAGAVSAKVTKEPISHKSSNDRKS